MSDVLYENFDIFLAAMKSQAAIDNIASLKRGNKNSRADAIANAVDSVAKDYRNVYDSVIPNVHVLKVEETINIIIDDFKGNPDKYLSTNADYAKKVYVDVKVTDANGEVTVVNQRQKVFVPNTSVGIGVNLTHTDIGTISKTIRSALATYAKSLPTYPEGNPLEDLNRSMASVMQQFNAMLEMGNSASMLVGELGAIYRSEIKSIFQKTTRSVGSRIRDTKTMRLSSKDFNVLEKDIVVFSKSFSGMKQEINSTITNAIIEGISKCSSITSMYAADGIQVGNAIHFGHSGIRERINSSVASMMFNSPAVSKLNLTKHATTSSVLLFKQRTDHYKYAITSKKVVSDTSCTAQIGITFTQSQASKINLGMASSESTQSGGTAASMVLKGLTATKRGLEDLRKILGIQGSKGMMGYKASDSLQDLLKKKIISKFTGNKGNVTISSGKSGILQVAGAPSIKVKETFTKGTSTNFGSEKSSGSKPSTPSKGVPLRNNNGSFYSLNSLQVLINTHLVHVLSASMGEEGYPGGQRRILNYRSGRFAGSAKVERMSKSREGMITAFYTYMKNPYDRYEPGGAQGSPKTRDPKLLIAGAIRETAAIKVGNRLRAVLI